MQTDGVYYSKMTNLFIAGVSTRGIFINRDLGEGGGEGKKRFCFFSLASLSIVICSLNTDISFPGSTKGSERDSRPFPGQTDHSMGS